jgi:hypothetical protein
MVRGAIGVVAAAAAWMVAFFALAWLLALAWPDYALHGQTWFTEQRFEFTAPQAGFNILFWVLAEIFAGCVTVVIAKRGEAAWVLAVLIGSYLALMHLYLEWDTFPWWYNLAVALPAIPAVLIGGRLATRFARPGRAIAAGPPG